jgi:hypothetical protein
MLRTPDQGATVCSIFSLRLVFGLSMAIIQRAAESLDQNRELCRIQFQADLFCNRHPVPVLKRRDLWGSSLMQAPPYVGVQIESEQY